MTTTAVAPVKPFPWRTAGRIAAGTALALTAATAFIGFLHTKPGRKLMAAAGVVCPVGHPTADLAIATRERGVASLRTDVVAPARPALGFTLEKTTEADIAAWAKTAGVACRTDDRGLRMVNCLDVPATAFEGEAALPPVTLATFAFAPNGTLLAVETVRKKLADDEAERLYADRRDALAKVVGAPTDETGDAHAASLTKGVLSNGQARFRFRDYLAYVNATNVGAPSGIMVRERYESANKPTM